MLWLTTFEMHQKLSNWCSLLCSNCASAISRHTVDSFSSDRLTGCRMYMEGHRKSLTVFESYSAVECKIESYLYCWSNEETAVDRLLVHTCHLTLSTHSELEPAYGVRISRFIFSLHCTTTSHQIDLKQSSCFTRTVFTITIQSWNQLTTTVCSLPLWSLTIQQLDQQTHEYRLFVVLGAENVIFSCFWFKKRSVGYSLQANSMIPSTPVSVSVCCTFIFDW